jgi:hypothetical protein
LSSNLASGLTNSYLTMMFKVGKSELPELGFRSGAAQPYPSILLPVSANYGLNIWYVSSSFWYSNPRCLLAVCISNPWVLFEVTSFNKRTRMENQCLYANLCVFIYMHTHIHALSYHLVPITFWFQVMFSSNWFVNVNSLWGLSLPWRLI